MDPSASRFGDLQKLYELAAEVDAAGDFNQLKALFYRVEEIVRQYPNDGEMNAAADSLRLRIRERGGVLAQGSFAGPPTLSGPLMPAVPPQPQAQPQAPTQTSVPIPVSMPAAPDLPSPVAPPLAAGGPPLEFAALGDLPPAQPAPPLEPPPEPFPPVPATPPPAVSWKPVIGGGLIGLLLFAGGVVLWKKPFRFQRPKPPVVTPVPKAATYALEISSDPPGAQIQIDGQPRCITPDCKVDLPPGAHQVMAALAGFDNESRAVTVENQTAPLMLKLRPLPPSLRISSNLEGWRVSFDDMKPVELQDGQWTLDVIPPGKHALRISGRTGEARLSIDVPEAPGTPPVVESLTASNVFAIALAGAGNQAKVRASEPVAVEVEGQPPVQFKQEAADLGAVPPGERSVLLGVGKDQRKVLMTFSPAATLSIHLLQNTTTGALVVLTLGEDGVQVFLDGKLQKKQTQKGQLRIYNLEPRVYTLRVAKDGFQPASEQNVTVKRGEETRVDFKLTPLPRVASLLIKGAQPGAAVLMGGAQVGTVQPDGSFTLGNITPGDQTIELRLRPFAPKQATRHFTAGQTVELSGAAVAMVRNQGKVTITKWVPPEAEVTIKKGEATVATLDRNRNSAELPEGAYTIVAHAPGYEPATGELKIGADMEVRPGVELAKLRTAPTIPTGMDGWANPAEWTKQDQWHVHQASTTPVVFRVAPTEGTFTFTVTLLKGRGALSNHPIRWMADYRGPGDFVLCEIDKKNFTRRQYVGGAEREVLQVKHGVDKAAYSLRVKVENGSLTTRILREENWELLDELKEPGHNFGTGKFAFSIRDRDVLGLSGFAFAPAH